MFFDYVIQFSGWGTCYRSEQRGSGDLIGSAVPLQVPYGGVTISCCLWADANQQMGRQGSRLPRGMICNRERHYKLLPVGCSKPAG